MKKKQILLLAAVVLVIGIPAVIMMQRSVAEPVETTITPKGGQANPTGAMTNGKTTTTNSTPIPQPTKVFLTYKDPQFTLSYPQDWTYTKNPLSSGAGTAFLLQPPNASRLTRPHILVKVIDTTISSVEKSTAEFRIFKYRKTMETLSGVVVTKYQQELSSPDGSMQSTGYVFQKGTKLYVFRLGYIEPARNAQLESEVTQMVAQYIATNKL